MSKKFRKHLHFTLIEILIALGLTAVILSTLFYFYRQTMLLEQRADMRQARAFQELYLESRLKEVLSHAKNPGKNSPFFTEIDSADIFLRGSENLLFTFDNGVKANKPFSYLVVGRLYLDPEGRLILATWPQPKWWNSNGELPPMQQEILLEQVEQLHFRCFVPPAKGQDFKLKELPVELLGQWVNKWERAYEQLPALIEVKLQIRQQSPLTLIVHLLNCSQPITYDRL